jgi:DNA-nicking Smr family endonuclease
MRPGRDKSLSSDDKAVWQKVAQSVKPIRHHYDSETFTEILNPAQTDPEAVRTVPASIHERPTAKVTRHLPELGVGHMPGLDRRTAERMTKGAFPIEGRLDLHGLTRDQAQAKLIPFLAHAYERGKRAVIIITGKGQAGSGVLKAEVPRWLNLPFNRDKILGFSHAQPKDGGDGALYVLIKRRRL